MLILAAHELDLIGTATVSTWSGALFGDGHGGIVLRLALE